jgi:DNA polymerase III sliding clamp (beta) subunit (PCNA family)
LQKELAFVQGVVERKTRFPFSRIFSSSQSAKTPSVSLARIWMSRFAAKPKRGNQNTGRDVRAGAQAFDISRLLPDAPVNFRKEENDWVTIKCERSNFKVPGVARDTFPEVPSFKSAPTKMAADIFKLY